MTLNVTRDRCKRWKPLRVINVNLNVIMMTQEHSIHLFPIADIFCDVKEDRMMLKNSVLSCRHLKSMIVLETPKRWHSNPKQSSSEVSERLRLPDFKTVGT
jgi:hypothetical protein